MGANKQPTLDLQANQQIVHIDVESLFAQQGYDVANWTAEVQVNNPTEQTCRLVLPYVVENTMRAYAVVVSSDAHFGKPKQFKKFNHSQKYFLDMLKKGGLVPAEAQKIPPELKTFVAGFKIVDLLIPAGTHKVRIHASQKLLPTADDPRAFELMIYAPLLNFVLNGGAIHMSADLVLPPDFAANTEIVKVEEVQLPGQGTTVNPAPFNGQVVQLGRTKALAWYWNYDPRVTVRYRYL